MYISNYCCTYQYQFFLNSLLPYHCLWNSFSQIQYHDPSSIIGLEHVVCPHHCLGKLLEGLIVALIDVDTFLAMLWVLSNSHK